MSEAATQEQVSADDWASAMAEQAPAAPAADAGASTQVAAAPIFEQFSAAGAKPGAHNDIDMILDIPVQLTVELGRTKIAIKNLLQLAQGEVVVVNDKFGIRLTDIITPSERLRKLKR